MNFKSFYLIVSLSFFFNYSCSNNEANNNSGKENIVKNEVKLDNIQSQNSSGESTMKFANDTNKRADRDSFFDPLPKVMYYRYYNERYGFEFFYPGYLIKSNPPENGDGQEFSTKDGLEIFAYGSNEIEISGKTHKEMFEDVKSNHEKIYLNKMGDNYFVVSGIDKGKLFWTKTYAGKRYTNTLYISYPVEMKRKYDSEIMGYAADTFKPGILD